MALHHKGSAVTLGVNSFRGPQTCKLSLPVAPQRGRCERRQATCLAVLASRCGAIGESQPFRLPKGPLVQGPPLNKAVQPTTPVSTLEAPESSLKTVGSNLVRLQTHAASFAAMYFLVSAAGGYQECPNILYACFLFHASLLEVFCRDKTPRIFQVFHPLVVTVTLGVLTLPLAYNNAQLVWLLCVAAVLVLAHTLLFMHQTAKRVPFHRVEGITSCQLFVLRFFVGLTQEDVNAGKFYKAVQTYFGGDCQFIVVPNSLVDACHDL